MTRFRDEIAEQPAVAERMLVLAREETAAAAAAIRQHRPPGLVIAARGSSDHAAIYAKYLLETRNRLPVLLAAPSVFGVYRQPPRLAPFAVLAISQSGASPDVAGVVEEARAQGAPTIAISGVKGSRLSRSAEYLVRLQTGREHSVPASKTYTASLLAVGMLSQALDPDPVFEHALAAVPAALAGTLDVEAHLDSAITLLEGERLAVIGRGYNLVTAFEIGLKLTETCYVVAEARSLADFLHGPVAAIEPGFPVLLVEAAGPTLRQLRAFGGKIAHAGARVVTITDRREGAAGHPVGIRTGLPEALTPLPFAVAGQLLALRMSSALGLDSDRPRGLRKVTETR